MNWRGKVDMNAGQSGMAGCMADEGVTQLPYDLLSGCPFPLYHLSYPFHRYKYVLTMREITGKWAPIASRRPCLAVRPGIALRPADAAYRFPRQHFLYFLPLPHGQGSLRPPRRDSPGRFAGVKDKTGAS